MSGYLLPGFTVTSMDMEIFKHGVVEALKFSMSSVTMFSVILLSLFFLIFFFGLFAASNSVSMTLITTEKAPRVETKYESKPKGLRRNKRYSVEEMELMDEN